MRNPGLLAFGITTCVLVPAAIHHLTAGPKQVAKLTAPSSKTMEIDGYKVEVSTDKSIIEAGGKIKVKLVGAVPAGKKATVELLLWESTGSNGSRVESPPRTLERESVTLVGSAKGATAELSFTLPGKRSMGMDGQSHYGNYEVVVVPPKTADRLEKLAKKARRDNPMTGDGDGKGYDAWASEFYTLGQDGDDSEENDGKLGKAARVAVQTRAVDSPVALTLPANMKVDEESVVKVRVTNPGKRKLSTTVSLGIPGNLRGEYLGLSEDDIEIATEEQTIDLAPWATKEVTFKVKPGKAGTLGLYARARCSGEQEDWKKVAAAAELAKQHPVDVVIAANSK
jgi:hypothetical protein